MASLPVRWIQVRAYCQATEDLERVREALDTVVSGGTPGQDRVVGQFGNPVLVVSRRLEKAEDVRATWKRWTEAGLTRDLMRDLEGRLDDDGVLHLRLDKQEAAQGRLSLQHDADAIDVQVKLKAYPANPEEIHRVARSLVSEAL